MAVANRQRDEIINANYGLVHACANRFKGRGIEYDDLYQAGCIGLIKAVDGFDESRGFAFSTYAVPVILGEIKRLFRDGGSIKVSRSLKEKALKLQRIRERFINENYREPTISELAELFGVDIHEVAELLSVSLPPVSLTCDSEEGGVGERDIAVDEEDSLFDKISLQEVVEDLPAFEQELVKLRYYKGLTQSKTAEVLGISQVQVSRKEKSILQKLREKLIE
ncbi:MAG: sigma-70 family RNA polymerase sigma factor [Clostridiales bacterium]|nr:sigma-70 family RNA polymerase sigma factor [Clostridiales bacterium]